MTTGEAWRDFDAAWNFADPAGTEATFRAFLEDAALDEAIRLQLLTQIARTQGLQKQFDAAHATLDEVERQLASRDAPVVHVRYLLERGRVLNTSGRPAEARPRFEEAWERARNAGEDGFAVDAAHMVAIVADPDEAIAWNERALELARSSDDPRARKWQGSLLNNLGWTYHGRGELDRALRSFEDALAFWETRNEPGRTRVARWCVARAWRSLGRFEEALAWQRDLAAAAAEGGVDGFVVEEIGECLLALGRAEEARPHFRRAWELLLADRWLSEREPERLARLLRLAEGGS